MVNEDKVILNYVGKYKFINCYINYVLFIRKKWFIIIKLNSNDDLLVVWEE